MKKLFLVAALVVAGFVSANAQFTFGAGLRLGLPVGDFSETHSFGVGGELQGEYNFSEKFSGVITTGYTSFFGKTIDFGFGEVDVDAVGLIPIIAGVRVYPSTSFFIGAQAGYGILTGGGESEGAFMYQPQIGYNAEKFQLALNYNALSKDGSTLGHIGLTGIFKFGGSGGSH
ncbi:MAG TPA: hypothetical protein VFZ42_16585 [Chitinophagaceae bacterium]